MCAATAIPTIHLTPADDGNCENAALPSTSRGISLAADPTAASVPGAEEQDEVKTEVKLPDDIVVLAVDPTIEEVNVSVPDHPIMGSGYESGEFHTPRTSKKSRKPEDDDWTESDSSPERVLRPSYKGKRSCRNIITSSLSDTGEVVGAKVLTHRRDSFFH